MLAVGSSTARAQFVRDETGDSATDEQERPDKRSGDLDIDVRITTTAFLHRETGEPGDALVDGGVAPDNASPFSRYFFDLRLQASAQRVDKRGWSTRSDARVRSASDNNVQSGASTGNEYEVRELSVRRAGRRTAFGLGRQTVGEVAATTIDGVRVDLRFNSRWRAVAFGGAYPDRGSRSLDTDYPRVRLGDGMDDGDRIIPIAAGVGGAYATTSLHTTAGMAAIAPLTESPDTGARDDPRLFLTTSGYWRPSRRASLYHYAVADVAGEAGAGLTNLSAGVNANVTRNVLLRASVHHIDTELLALTARNHLEDPDTDAMGVVQNNIEVQRISSDSARGTVSVSLARRRFQLSASGGLRRRPELSVPVSDGSEFTFPETRAAEATLTVLDRRSILGLRLGATFALVTPIGDAAPTASSTRVARVRASRQLAKGRGQWQLDLGYLHGEDSVTSAPCTGLDPLACYGAASVRALQGGGLLAAPVTKATLLIADVHVGAERVTATGEGGNKVEQPTRLVTTGFLRIQRRF